MVFIDEAGAWCQMAACTAAYCANVKAHGVTAVYPEYGHWHSDNSIHQLPTDQQCNDAIAACHDAGLWCYPWIISNGVDGTFDETNLAAAEVAIEGVVSDHDFDGVADDIESFGWNWDLLVDWWNQATVAMNAVGKGYFTTIVISWLNSMDAHEAGLAASIRVDMLQLMLYDGVLGKAVIQNEVDDIFNNHGVKCPIELAVIADVGHDDLTDLISWITEMIEDGDASYLASFGMFDYGTCDAAEWDEFKAWFDSYNNPPGNSEVSVGRVRVVGGL